PRAGELADALEAVGEEELAARRRIESDGLLGLGTGMRERPLGGEPARLVEEGLRRGLLLGLGGLGAGRRGDRCDRNDQGRDSERAPQFLVPPNGSAEGALGFLNEGE